MEKMKMDSLLLKVSSKTVIMCLLTKMVKKISSLKESTIKKVKFKAIMEKLFKL